MCPFKTATIYTLFIIYHIENIDWLNLTYWILAIHWWGLIGISYDLRVLSLPELSTHQMHWFVCGIHFPPSQQSMDRSKSGSSMVETVSHSWMTLLPVVEQIKYSVVDTSNWDIEYWNCWSRCHSKQHWWWCWHQAIFYGFLTDWEHSQRILVVCSDLFIFYWCQCRLEAHDFNVLHRLYSMYICISVFSSTSINQEQRIKSLSCYYEDMRMKFYRTWLLKI